MGKRITEHPLRLRFNVLESSANTYTEEAHELPLATIVRTSEQVQAIEPMKLFITNGTPDIEDDQTNVFEFALLRDTDTTIRDYDDENVIFKATMVIDDDFTTSGNAAVGHNLPLEVDLTDGDGRGEILLERTIYSAVLGTGNAAAKRAEGYLLYHIVELDSNEAAMMAIAQDE